MFIRILRPQEKKPAAAVFHKQLAPCVCQESVCTWKRVLEECVLFGLLWSGSGVTAALLLLLLWQPIKNFENIGAETLL